MARISTNRKSGFILRSGVMRRETSWFAGSMVATTLVAASSAAIVTSLNAAALALRPFTVIRTRGRLLLQSDITGVTESYQAQYGHAIVSDQAVAVGITAVPTPNTDSGSDLWYVFETMMGGLRVTSDIGRFIETNTQEFDSKAMRKVEPGQDLVAVAEASSISNGLTLFSWERTLIKLH